jgi:hypothetical protein
LTVLTGAVLLQYCSNTGIKTLRLKKLNQIELKRRKLRILRELGKTYLKILIKTRSSQEPVSFTWIYVQICVYFKHVKRLE